MLFAVFLHRGILAVPSAPTPVWSWCTFDLAIPSRAQPEFFSKNSLAGAVFPVCSALKWTWRAPAGWPGHGGILVLGPGRGGWGGVGTPGEGHGCRCWAGSCTQCSRKALVIGAVGHPARTQRHLNQNLRGLSVVLTKCMCACFGAAGPSIPPSLSLPLNLPLPHPLPALSLSTSPHPFLRLGPGSAALQY